MNNIIHIKVRGYHIDFFGHVNNARYLEFLEEARWCFFEEPGGQIGFTRLNLDFVVANINISYRYPATMGDLLTIETHLGEIRRSSAVLRQTIGLAGQERLVAEADVTFVFLDADSGNVRPITGDALALLDALPGGSAAKRV
jgi:thioesterase-3